MSNYHLALLIVRFSALSFVFYAVLEVPDFLMHYQDFSTLYAEKADVVIAKQNFARIVFRIGLQLLAAAFLFGKTFQIVSLLTVGRWQSTPQSSENEKA